MWQTHSRFESCLKLHRKVLSALPAVLHQLKLSSKAKQHTLVLLLVLGPGRESIRRSFPIYSVFCCHFCCAASGRKHISLMRSLNAPALQNLWQVCSCWPAELPWADSLAPSSLAARSVEDPGKTAEASPLTSGMPSGLHKLQEIKPNQTTKSSWSHWFKVVPKQGCTALESSGIKLSLPDDSHFNSNTRFSFSKVLIKLDFDLFAWVVCLKGIISHLLTVVISLLRWLKHLFSAIFSPATHPTPTN